MILDKELEIINHSDEWLKEHRIEQDSLVGQSIYNIQPELPLGFLKILKQSLHQTKNNSAGEKFHLSDGGVVWLSWRIKPWRDADGAALGLIVILDNITIAKRKEELLKKAQAVAKIGGWEVDLIANEVFWTDTTRKIHELPKEYMPKLQEGINFYKAGEHRDRISLLVSEAISSGTPWDTESIIITGKNNEIWIRSKGEVEIVNGKCVRIFGTFQDINEQKKADLRYREISDRLTIATKAAGFGIWEYNVLDNSLIWDDNMYWLYGIKKKDFSGVLEAWESSIHPKDKERMLKELEMAIAGEKEFKTEFRVVSANGRVRFIKAEAVIQRDTRGEPLKMIGINWDISEIRKADIKLKKLWNTTREQNEGLTNFAYIVSHNLRTHATNLSALSGILVQSEHGGFQPEDEERKNIVKMINDGAESLTETITHLNEVVQIRSDVKEKIEKINLRQSIQGVLSNIGKVIADQNAIYDIDVDENVEIKAIPAYLDSILLNLFTNSLRYSHPERRLKINVSATKIKNKVVVKFWDNGQGIDLKRYGKKIFGMYKTFHKHKDSKGIGLFITKNQIEAMGGKIDVKSVVGEWTEFNLFFKH
jgi:PAS domain S-box-containing protein